MGIQRNILLNPGPATTTDTVKYAQVVPDICPRENEFGAVMEFVAKELTEFVAPSDEYTTVLFGGSGTAAVESMISSSVLDGGKVLIINNGAYGKRMVDIAEAYEIQYIEYNSSVIDAIDLNKLEEVIIKEKTITHLAMIHHETTTGLLNDVKRVGEICKKYDLELIVDAMSSYAGIPIDMKAMNIKFLASSSNKCIQGMAGISFVIVQNDSLNSLKNRKSKNYYLNLYKQYDYFKENYQMRFTPPVQVLYALKQAIIEAKEEGVEKRYNRYSRCCHVLWDGLNEIGLERIVSEENHSKLITSIIEPKIKGYTFDSMHDYLYERGFTIYPGKIESQNTFRIANIGDIAEEDMIKFIKILKDYFNKLG